MAKKKFQAIKADVGNYEGIRHEGKEYRFGSDDTFILDDEGLARELDQTYGRKGTQKVAITAYDDTTTREPGHKYTFGPTARFAEAWDAFEKRRKRRNVAPTR